MHMNGMVLLRDAWKVEGISSVLKELVEKNKIFHVKRTSGDIETGWSVIEDDFEYPSLQKFDGMWRVYLSNTKVRKFVALEEFVGHGDLSAESVNVATEILDRGVYLPEYEKQSALAIEANTVTEQPCVATAMMLNGSLVRVVVPQGDQLH